MCKVMLKENMPPVPRWTLHKEIIKDAAALVRQDILIQDPDRTFCKSMMAASVSRAVWRQDSVLALLLINRSKLAAAHLAIIYQEVTLKDPVAFSNMVNMAKAEIIGEETADVNKKDFVDKPGLAQALARQRRLALWLPSSARLFLTGIRVPLPQGGFSVATTPKR